MAGIDENVGVPGDWSGPSPSPRTFFSVMLGEDNVARSMSDPPPGGDGAQDGDQKLVSRGGLVERMAARAGFNAPRLNTDTIRSTDLSLNSDVPSPYLTIPPGLSPTTLLDSPVFLTNSLAQPSPTTGKFPFISNGNISSDAPERCKDNSFDDIYASSFAFKPTTDLGSSFYQGAARKMNPTTIAQQSLPSVEVPVQSEHSFQSRSANVVKSQTQNKNGLHLQPDFIESSPQQDTVGVSVEHSPQLEEQADEEGEPRGNGDSMAAGFGGAPSEDGYNWRKYGQKQVKGSEYPRSYYKCTHPNCPVKKKVERSHEGHITEIIYKGAHNHPKPPPNRRSGIASANPPSDMQMDNPEHVERQSGSDGELGWANLHKGNVAGAANWKNDNLEVTSSASVAPEYCNQSTNSQAQNGTQFDSGDAVDASSTFSNEDDDDDRGTHGSVSLGYDGEGDESESKRRKLESYATELSGATRAIREPRVVVQTTSEVDILDDGYRWRKYGQKVVKGNPNPRSYYKCTNAGCTVRKHVERASHDLKSVITTYEGKHNHDVPAARSSSHVNANASGSVPGQAPGVLQPHVHRPEPTQVPGGIGRLERPPALGAFSLPGRQQLGPPHGFSFGMNQPLLPNLAMPGFGPGQAKLPVMPVHPFLATQQQRPPNEMGFMLPKGEPNVEPIPERHNLPSGSYQDLMSRMPLGPHM
ncbi:probable WRKY transcription factor 2 isoform X1 [Arachis stenosperma]|uniref:probable WRKY transcription factor 2 isoform X1 n=1 Tax=Arachis stenosperma TaxID=217475 RepID=UPI0025AD774D|nr:probable WRKY transcription factor 2 isoform X1 [Arachis stenosperma]